MSNEYDDDADDEDSVNAEEWDKGYYEGPPPPEKDISDLWMESEKGNFPN